LHHLVFDRGAITVTRKYRITVATPVTRSASTTKWLWDYDDAPLLLPRRACHYPDPRHLAWHHRNRFQGVVPG
jgi:predicted restriction endonuclease